MAKIEYEDSIDVLGRVGREKLGAKFIERLKEEARKEIEEQVIKRYER